MHNENTKIISISGGLGNQMTAYATYLAVKKYNPFDQYYFEGIAYMFDAVDSIVSQWNGYELKRIFGLKLPDILDAFSTEERNVILTDLHQNDTWNNSWEDLYSVYLEILHKHGLDFMMYENIEKCPSFKAKMKMKLKHAIYWPSKSIFSFKIKNLIRRLARNANAGYSGLCEKREGNWYFPIVLDAMKSKFLLTDIQEELRTSFVFPDILDEKNANLLKNIHITNSVAIHARRSDFLQYNNDCYKYGYFKRCVKYIRRHVEDPVFFIFSEDSDWCKSNCSVFGLNENGDTIYFIDWNKGNESYRDMQLMAQCKHNIITKSSFGWWASFLNENPNKITCSQYGLYYTNHKF